MFQVNWRAFPDIGDAVEIDRQCKMFKQCLEDNKKVESLKCFSILQDQFILQDQLAKCYEYQLPGRVRKN